MLDNYVKRSMHGAAKNGAEADRRNITSRSTYFGLADLGFGCPELGYFSLRDIGSVRLPFGLFIERDDAFSSDIPLTRWTDLARREGSILAAEAALRGAPKLPPGDPGG